jgi:hypothetical protein
VQESLLIEQRSVIDREQPLKFGGINLPLNLRVSVSEPVLLVTRPADEQPDLFGFLAQEANRERS